MNPQFDHFLVWLDKSTRSGINSFARSFVRRKSYVSRRLSAFPIEASTWQAKENSEVMSAAIRSLQDILSHKNAAGSPLRKGWEESGSWELERNIKDTSLSSRMQTCIQKFPVVLRPVNQFNPNRPCVSWGFLVMGKKKHSIF